VSGFRRINVIKDVALSATFLHQATDQSRVYLDGVHAVTPVRMA
jgi:hypothetical protein